MKKIIILLLTFVFISNVYAFEDEYFKIDIPDNYKENFLDNGIYKWENTNSYLAISIASNSQNKYDVEKFTENDIQKQKEYLEKSLNENLIEYNIEVTITNIEKKELGKYTFLEYDLYYPSIKKTGHNIYQRGRMYTTNKYIITTIYSSNKKDFDNEFNKIINTFEIKDSLKVETINKKGYFSLMIFLGVTLGVIGYFTTSKKRK